MELHAAQVDLGEWKKLKERFYENAEAISEICAVYRAEDDIDASLYDARAASLRQVAFQVIEFAFGIPAFFDEKREMSGRLIRLSAEDGEAWCEDIAIAMSVSTGEAPPLWPQERPTRLVEPIFAPAVAFWDAHFEGKLSKKIINAVIETQPINVIELADKAMVAMAAGVMDLAYELVREGSNLNCDAIFRRVYTLSREDCLEALREPRPFQELMTQHAVEFFAGGLSGAMYVRLAIGLASPKWRKSLWDDTVRLGVVKGAKLRTLPS